MRIAPLALVTILAALGLAACGGDDEETVGDSQTIEPSAVTVEEDVELGDFFIEPGVIEATLGNQVALSLENTGEEAHTFTIDEFFVDEPVPAGEDAEVEFIPNEAGEFNYYCKIHPEGMRGALRIARPGEDPPGGETEPTDSPEEENSGGFGY
jgi:plastocyanin